MAQPTLVSELTPAPSLSAGAAVMISQDGQTFRTTAGAFITQADSYTPQGAGGIAEPVQNALQRSAHSDQYSSQANYDSARAALSGTTGVNSLDVGGSLSVSGGAAVGGSLSVSGGAAFLGPVDVAGTLSAAGGIVVTLAATQTLSNKTLASPSISGSIEGSYVIAGTYTLGGTPTFPSSVAKLNTEDQALTGGVIVTSKDLGTISSGTVTPDPGDRPMQHYTNGGAHTLAPSSNVGSVLLDITNNASAGAVTTSGFGIVLGDSFTTTSGHKFRCHISIGNAGSLLQVVALQ